MADSRTAPRARGPASAAGGRALVALGAVAAVLVVAAVAAAPSRSASQPATASALIAEPAAVGPAAAEGAAAAPEAADPSATSPAADPVRSEALAALDALWTAEPHDPTTPWSGAPAAEPETEIATGPQAIAAGPQVSSRIALALEDRPDPSDIGVASDLGPDGLVFRSYAAIFTNTTRAPDDATATPVAGRGPLLPRDAADGALRVLIVGDSLGNGLFRSFARLRRVDELRASRRSRHSTGFSRPDYFDWNAEIGPILAAEAFDAIIVYVGANDGQDIVAGGRRHHPGDAGWREIYAERVDAFMATLAATGRPVYWVGLPITRSRRLAGFYETMNEIYGTAACRHGVAFIDVWDRFAPRGRFDAHGPGPNGRRARLRHDDGIHLSNAGYDVVVGMVETAMAQPIAPGASADACRR